MSAHTRSHALHSRSKSQPRLRTPPGAPTRAHALGQARKLSTVQASPVVKTLQPIDSEAEATEMGENGIQKCREQAYEDTFSPKRLVSLRSVSSLRRPLGPRQPSPRSATGTSSSADHRAGTKEKEQRCLVAPLQDGTRSSGALPASAAVRDASPVHAALFPPTPSTPQTSTTAHTQTSAAKQLSGKPARSRSRARVLADLTGFARNVDLSAHGVGTGGKNRPGKVKGARAGENAGVAASYTKGRGVGGMKNSEDKENVGTRAVSGAGRMRTFGDKENARVPFGTPDMHGQSQSQSRSLSLFQPQAKSTPKDHDASTESAVDPLAVLANLSTATNTTKGSVRDRMMDWERERARLREMNRASTVLSGSRSSSSSASTSASSTTQGDSDSDSDSEVEAEVMAEASLTAVAKPTPIPAKPETVVKTVPMHTIALARTRSGQTMHTTTTAVSSASGLAASTLTGGSGSREKGEIEVAKLCVRAPAQILTSRNGSLSAVALGQTLGQVMELRRSEEVLKAVDGGSIALVKGESIDRFSR